MEREKASHAVTTMCRVLGISTSGYWAWRKRDPSVRRRRDDQLTEQIITVHAKSRQTYGVLRIHADLRASAVRCGKKRVARLMHRATVINIKGNSYRMRAYHDEQKGGAIVR